MSLYTDGQVAHVCHEANRALMLVNGDEHVSPHWEDIPEWWRASAIADVRDDRGATPQQLHAEWMRRKVQAGWRYGPIRSEAIKTHPCMVEYHRLPPGERMKDALYLAIIAAMSQS